MIGVEVSDRTTATRTVCCCACAAARPTGSRSAATRMRIRILAAPLNPITASRLPQLPARGSPAARELAVLVLEHERTDLRQRVVDIALVDDPLGRELHVAHLVLYVPGL